MKYTKRIIFLCILVALWCLLAKNHPFIFFSPFVFMIIVVFLTADDIIETEFISLDKQNAMFRPICIGKHEGKWFFRSDWWIGGIRIKQL